jgi:exopolysaccharide biosynthesis polyprenyl glycosylphosphotransferase
VRCLHNRQLPVALLIADLIGIALGVAIALSLNFVEDGVRAIAPARVHVGPALGITAIWLVSLCLCGAYERDYLRLPVRSLYLTFSGVLLALALTAVLMYLVPGSCLPRTAYLVMASVTAPLLALGRVLWRLKHAHDPRHPILLLGQDELFWEVWAAVHEHLPTDTALYAVNANGFAATWSALSGVPVVPVTEAQAHEMVAAPGPKPIVLAGTTLYTRQQTGFLAHCCLHGAAVLSVMSFYELAARKLPIFPLAGEWWAQLQHEPLSSACLCTKRWWDLAVTLVAAPFALLLAGIGAVLVKCTSPGPAIFRQRRVGLGGVEFDLVKLRTMRVDAEAETGAVWAASNDARTTPVGRFLRATGIDELPQFWNVLRGEMSLVGPRPERPEIVEQLCEELPLYPQRHAVPPGITGWAQIHQGGDRSLDDVLEKLRLDLYYAKHFSFTLDLRILVRTVQMLLVGRKPTSRRVSAAARFRASTRRTVFVVSTGGWFRAPGDAPAPSPMVAGSRAFGRADLQGGER